MKNTTGKTNTMFKGFILLPFILISAFSAKAQWDDIYTDTTATDSSYYGETEDDDKEDEIVKPPPYQRVKLYVDSVTELITYQEVVEEDKCDYCTQDSLYLRTKKWLLEKFYPGKKEFPKDVFIIDKVNEKITFLVRIPLMLKRNEYSINQRGELEFQLTIWYQEGRYKYRINNFVHWEQIMGQKPGTLSKTYMEFYLTGKHNIIGNDKVLIATDNYVNAFIKEMKMKLTDSPMIRYLEEENDW